MFRNGTLFMIAGGALFLWGMWEGFQAFGSGGWPSVKGTIISSKVVSESSGTGKSRGTTYKAEIEYEYQVDGASYENDRLRIGRISIGFKSFPQADVRRHPRGTTNVYYDPGKPENSVLEPGLHWALCLKPFVGSLFFAVGVVMFRGRKHFRPLLSRAP